MLLSTVFVLRPLTAGTVPLTQGNAIHAWFLHLVQQQAPSLAAWLHSQEQRKPFTTSPLQEALSRQGTSALVRPQHTYWLRVTSLDPDLGAVLLAIEATPPSQVRLFQVVFEVCTVTNQARRIPGLGRAPTSICIPRSGRARRQRRRPWSSPRRRSFAPRGAIWCCPRPA